MFDSKLVIPQNSWAVRIFLAAALSSIVAVIGAWAATDAPRKSSMVSFHDGKHLYEVRQQNGDLTITEDGNPISEERIVRDGDHVIIESPTGDLMAFLKMSEDGTLYYTGSSVGRVLHSEPSENLRIGVTIGRLGRALAAQLGLEENEAILIRSVDAGGPARAAGIEEYDVISEIEGRKVKSQRDLRNALQALEEGEELQLSIIRQGRERKIEVRPERLPTPPAGVLPPDALLAPGAPDAEIEAALRGLRRPDLIHLSEDGGGVAYLAPGFSLPPGGDYVQPDRERLERLEKRLERLEEMLEELLAKGP